MSEVLSKLIDSQAFWGTVGVLVGVFATSVLNLIGYVWKQRQLRTYAAIRIVCSLDEFYDSCVAKALDYGETDTTRYDEGETVSTVSFPDAPIFAGDIDWKALSTETAYQVLSLPNRLTDIKQTLSIVAEHASPPDYDDLFPQQQYLFARLALDIIELSSELRRKYNLAARTTATSVENMVDRMNEIVAEMKAEIERFQRESRTDAKAILETHNG